MRARPACGSAVRRRRGPGVERGLCEIEGVTLNDLARVGQVHQRLRGHQLLGVEQCPIMESLPQPAQQPRLAEEQHVAAGQAQEQPRLERA